jgi:hypothetical protein
MTKNILSKGIRKHIRKEKSRICREVLNPEEQKKLINQLYMRFFKEHNSKAKNAS